MKTIWPKATKWTGIVLFLITFSYFMLLMSVVDGMSKDTKYSLDANTDRHNLDKLMLEYKDIYISASESGMIMSTILFVGGLIAEQLASNKDE